jgi:hypothetical protein
VPRFKVMTYDRGKWDYLEPRIVEARNAKEAAEKVCGSPLIKGSGKLGNLRAKVWPAATKVEWFSTLPG